MTQNRPPLRSLLVPTEHGGWGFSIEPGLLGILVAPGVTSGGLAVFALFTFLADRPTRMVLGDLYRRRRLQRTVWAAWIAGGYGGVAVTGLTVAVISADHPFWWVLLAALPIVGLQLSLEARGRMRAAVREMAGPVAVASIAAAAAVADGIDTSVALGLWLVIALRVIVSVSLVRAQIRRVKDREPNRPMVMAIHGLALSIGVAAALAGAVSWAGIVALAMLTGWAVVALAAPPVRANIVGVTQMIAGLMVVVLIASGHPPA